MQRLHGMGEALYHGAAWPVRVYAPVGTHEDLLAYLVRRLLENGANTSFVHRLVDPSVPEEAIIADPVHATASLGRTPIRAFHCRAICIPIASIPPASIWPIAMRCRALLTALHRAADQPLARARSAIRPIGECWLVGSTMRAPARSTSN